jgi:lipid A ethanolaminephosphotransferase
MTSKKTAFVEHFAIQFMVANVVLFGGKTIYDFSLALFEQWQDTQGDVGGSMTLFVFFFRMLAYVCGGFAVGLFAALSRHLMPFITVPYFILSGIYTYFSWYYDFIATGELASIIFASSMAEAAEFLSPSFFLWMLLVLCVALLLVWVFYKDKERSALSFGGVLKYVSIALCFYLVAVGAYPKAVVFNLVDELLVEWKEQNTVKKLLTARENIAKKAGVQFTGKEDMVVVIVLGESLRGDYLHINGYEKQNTPKMEKIPNLVSFSFAESCASYTYLSVPCMLSRATEKNWDVSAREGSLLSVFKEAGFRVHWISNKLTGLSFIAESAMDVDEKILLGGKKFKPRVSEYTDAMLLAPYAKILEKPGNKVIVLDTVGNHWRYNLRYPKAFEKFAPACSAALPQLCKLEELKNAYNNSILFFDHFMDEIIASLPQKNAMVVYMADHGEMMGEKGMFTHGVYDETAFEQLRVPMIWWMSPAFLEWRGDIYETLMLNKDNPVSHDHFFHSVLDCAGIHTSLVDEDLSVCREKE